MNRLIKQLGPGLLYAGAAIGVSHLVQSTRAGALFGFQLFGIIILVNIIKYPFFETGSRYSGATGKSLIDAYGQMNKTILWLYAMQTFVTMFIIQAALTIVTTGLLKAMLNLQIDNWIIASCISISTVLILIVGQYGVLKDVTKWIVITLTVATIIAVVFAIGQPVEKSLPATPFSIQNKLHIAFLVALLGWMPAPIDISVWQSVWRVDGNDKGDLKQSLTDFHVGYWATTLIAISFLSLGALIFYRTGTKLATNGSEFALQLIELYTTSIGQWAWPIVAFASFATMFTTCLTCLDANPRVLQKTFNALNLYDTENKTVYFLLLIASASFAVLIPMLSGKSMTALVDFATTVSFLTAPIFATLNHKINFGKQYLTAAQQPNRFTYWLSILGLLFLYGFSIYFIWSKVW